MLRICFCNEISPSLKNIPHDIYTIYTFVSRFFTFLSSPVIIRFIKRRYTIGTVRGKESDDRNQPIGFGLKNIVPTSTINITGAGKTATAALYTLRLSTTKVFIYTSLLFKQNRSVMQGGFCCIASQTVHIVNFTQTHYKIYQKNYKKILKKAKV